MKNREVETGEIDLFSGERTKTIQSVNALWEKVDSLRVTYTKRGDKYRQFSYWGVQVDLFTCVPDGWGWALLVRTGSVGFSRKVCIALNAHRYASKDFRIHCRNLFGGAYGEPIKTREEDDVFRLACLRYVEPEERSI